MGSPLLWTGTTALAALRNTIQDPSGAASQRWTDAELVAYLNRALQQIVLDTETAIETSWKSDLTAGVREYALPDNFFKDRVVEYVKASDDVRRLKYLDREEFEDLYASDPTSAGEPQFYWYWARKGSDPTVAQPGSIYLVPTPDATAAGNVGDYKLRIWGYKVPDAISASVLTRTIELDAPYVESMLQFAAALAMMDDGNPGMYDRMMANYERMIRKIIDTRAQKSRSRFSRIRPWQGSTLVLPWRREWED